MGIWEKGQTRVACITTTLYNSGVIIQRKQHNSRTSTAHRSDMRWSWNHDAAKFQPKGTSCGWVIVL